MEVVLVVLEERFLHTKQLLHSNSPLQNLRSATPLVTVIANVVMFNNMLGSVLTGTTFVRLKI